MAASFWPSVGTSSRQAHRNSKESIDRPKWIRANAFFIYIALCPIIIFFATDSYF